MSKISVVIPNYNRANLIGETLENLLRQTRAPDEVIVVDDGSSDNSVAVIQQFGSQVRLIRQENSGPAAARNRGLVQASGDFIQFFDSDDLCSLNKLEVQARALEQTGADLAYGPWLQAGLADGYARYAEHALQQHPLPAHRSALSSFLQGWVIVFQCCMFRRSLLDRAGPYREDLTLGEDLELLSRILLTSPRLVHTPEALVLYRLHGAQISRGEHARQKRAEDLVHFTALVAAQLERHPAVSPADRAQWQWQVWDARRQLHQLDPARNPPLATGVATELGFRMRKVLMRGRAGLSRRIAGTSFSPPFGVGPLSNTQQDLIRALGYDPVRDPAAGA